MKALYCLFIFFLTIHPTYANFELDSFVKEKIKTETSHVVSAKYNGKKVWIKRTDHNKKGYWNCVVKNYFLKKIPFQILRSQAFCGANSVLNHEIKRIAELQKQGVLVPIIIGRGKDWIMLSDLGTNLEDLIESTQQEERLHLALKAAANLGDLHKQGFWHGRGHIKDMVVTGQDIGFIDFEAMPEKESSLTLRQARDFLMFCYSIFPYFSQDQSAYKKILLQYHAHTSQQAWNELKRTICYLSPFLMFLSFFENYLGADLRRAIKVYRVLSLNLKEIS